MSVFSEFEEMTWPNAVETPQYHYADTVVKVTGDYTGPGIVRGLAVLANGQLRYLVAHTLAGGEGELLHVYSESNLRGVV